MNDTDKCLRAYPSRDTLRGVMGLFFVTNSGKVSISIKRLDFKIYEQQDDGDYSLLQPDAKWYMILEITTVNVKEKPKDRELLILQSLQKLLKKIDTLNENVQKLPDKPPEENPKKYSFGLLVAILVSLFGGFMWWVNKSSA